MSTYQKRHNLRWGEAGNPRPATPDQYLLSGIYAASRGMIIVSRDYKYAEPGKHPTIGSEEDHENVLATALKAGRVIMGHHTLSASRYGVPCDTLYIATRDPSRINYDLPVFKKDQRRVLVTPQPQLPLSPFWHSCQNFLPLGALVLGGPRLLSAYYEARMLQSIEITMSPHLWPNGLRWQPSFPMVMEGGPKVRANGETITQARVLYATK